MKNILNSLSLIFLIASFGIAIQSCNNASSKTEKKEASSCCKSESECNSAKKDTSSCCSGDNTKEANSSCCSENKTANIDNSDVKAYYFHATRRCATCEAVEKVTQESLKELYGSSVSFTSINRDEYKDNPMIEKYKVSGQTLLIIKGDKVVNLTNNAFMNARTKPEKLKADIKSTIDSML